MRMPLLLSLLVSTSALAAKAPVAIQAPSVRFAEAINAGRADAASALIDTDALTDAAVKGLAVPAPFVAQLREGQRKTATGLTTQLVKNVQQGATFKLLGTQGGKRATSIYRQHSPAGLAYFEMTWRVGDGPVKIIDVRPLAGATSFLEDARRLSVVAAAESDASVAKTLSKGDRLYLENLPTYTSLAVNLQAGKSAEALAAYDALPQLLRQEKLALIFRIQAARLSGDTKLYLAAMDDLMRHHASDPTIVLPTLDVLFSRGEFPRLLKALNALDKRVGGDPYLEVLRNTVYAKQGNAVAGRKALTRATQREPSLREPWTALLDLAMKDADYAETARLLDASAKGADIDWGGVAEAEVFAGFRASPEGAAWIKRQSKR